MNRRLWNLNQTLRAHLSLVPLGCQCRQLSPDFRCSPGQTFHCPDCDRLMAYCFGAADDNLPDSELCDDCWSQKGRSVA